MANDSRIKLVLVGMGSAGRSRLKALADVPGFRLSGIVSRRLGMGDCSFEDVLSDLLVDAVAISTENTDHPISVRHALEAGKHVLCDYPLCFSEGEARDLYSLAERKKKILHVEHLGVLMAAHQILKNQIPDLEPLLEGEFTFTANWNESLRDEKRQGPFPFLAESRLVQVADLFGDFEMEDPSWDVGEEGATLSLTLSFKKGGRLRFTEKRFPGAPRHRHLLARFQKGELAWPGVVEPPGLFAKDLAHFRERILKGVPNYYDEGLMMKVLRVLEALIQDSK